MAILYGHSLIKHHLPWDENITHMAAYNFSWDKQEIEEEVHQSWLTVEHNAAFNYSPNTLHINSQFQHYPRL